MAFGAAPTNKRNGIPATTSAENRMTSPPIPRYGAITRATGREMAMDATFMIKFVIIMTKKAIPRMKTRGGELSKSASQCTASHLAAPVSHRQKPMDMAPAKRRIIFHGISSRSSIFRIFNKKKAIVEQSRIPVLSRLPRAGTKFFKAITTIVETTITVVMISFLLQLPSSAYILMAFCLRPGIRSFSGLKNNIKNPQSRKVMIQPMGNM